MMSLWENNMFKVECHEITRRKPVPSLRVSQCWHVVLILCTNSIFFYAHSSTRLPDMRKTYFPGFLFFFWLPWRPFDYSLLLFLTPVDVTGPYWLFFTTITFLPGVSLIALPPTALKTHRHIWISTLKRKSFEMWKKENSKKD